MNAIFAIGPDSGHNLDRLGYDITYHQGRDGGWGYERPTFIQMFLSLRQTP